jgi:hypothetical protein
MTEEEVVALVNKTLDESVDLIRDELVRGLKDSILDFQGLDKLDTDDYLRGLVTGIQHSIEHIQEALQ